MRGSRSLALAGLFVAALAAPIGLSAPAGAAPPVLAERDPVASGADFNGDGFADVVTGYPEETVDGNAAAGAVRVIFGGGAGSVLITQNAVGIPGAAEAGDRFGHAVAAWNSPYDEYPALVISAPLEGAGSATESGEIWVIPGSATGLEFGSTYTYRQGKGGVPGTLEAGDRFGWSLSAGRELAIGSPGEDVGDVADAGSVTVIGNERIVSFHQDSANIAGTNETGDRYGWSVSIDGYLLAVGTPHEGVGSVPGAGAVQLVTIRPDGTPNNAWPAPATLNSIDQGRPGVTGTPETGDHFGWSVSLVPSGDDGRHSLAVGVPDEAIGDHARAGGLHAFHIDDLVGGYGEYLAVDQGSAGVPGTVDTGDRFASTVVQVLTDGGPAIVTHTGTETGDGEGRDMPALHVFHPALGTSAIWLEAGGSGIPDGMLLAPDHIGGTRDRLLVSTTPVGVPYRVIGVPWSDILAGGTDPIVEYLF
ncbi:FG-GAP repeat protein [Phytomonospora endophytica]|uniref:Uncharacterized protein n=1 Tax=Phytomonospora endophytica TaxID=714109 RepID=A0A841FUQ2_9ACTN|nr:FG-GAP repeat protein [Phytomonospora endophytica]MBB6037077.1 hypothetical protein [Phytomonospora endophytica]GIG69381.1 hypothetical protein Pen01_56760 [Phytomonospora endophytica]